jgi:hypothetical protein
VTPAASPNPPSGAAGIPSADSPVSAELKRGAAGIGGLLLIVIGVMGWSWQAGFVLGGSMLFAWAYITSGKARKPEPKKAE